MRAGWKAAGSKRSYNPVRNFHQGFEHGLLPGLVHSGLQQVLGAEILVRILRTTPVT